MPNVTVAFDEGVGGWTSEFDFLPDSGLSLNNKYFTFYNGRLWQHNQLNLPRNNFYGIQNNTIIEFVFNDSPTVVKNFKTLGFEGEGEWSADVNTNLESGRVTRFLTKEGKRYSWIEGGAEQKFEGLDYASNAVQGIGTITGFDTGNMTITFEQVPDFITAGDALYALEQTSAGVFTETPSLIGLVESVEGNVITYTFAGVPGIINGVTFGPQNFHSPVTGDFVMYIKDNRQEKSGVIGYYSIITMTNEDTEKAEMFSVNSNSFITTV